MESGSSWTQKFKINLIRPEMTGFDPSFKKYKKPTADFFLKVGASPSLVRSGWVESV